MTIKTMKQRVEEQRLHVLATAVTRGRVQRASDAAFAEEELTAFETQTASDLALKIDAGEKGAANGVATLDAAGRVPFAQISLVAITDVFIAASEAEQLGLVTERGDVVVRSDLNRSYMKNTGTSGTMADWTELKTPTDAVLSVNGLTGAVVLVAGDIGFTPSGDVAATTVQAAIAELASEKLPKSVSAGLRLLGRGSAGAGDAQEIGLGEGVGVDGTTLYAAGGALTPRIAAGVFYDGTQATYALAATGVVTAGRIQLYPFIPSHNVSIDQLGVNVTVAAAGAAKVVVYASNDEGWPSTLLHETADLDTGTTGAKAAVHSRTFVKGRLYWIGTRFSATPTVTIVPNTTMRPLAKPTAGANPTVHLNIGGYAYAAAAPNPAPAAASAYLSNLSPPAAFLRVV